MQSHTVDYEIIGDDMQLVEVELDPRETVIAEAGAMNYMGPDIGFEAKMGDGAGDAGGDQKGEVSAAGSIYRMLSGK